MDYAIGLYFDEKTTEKFAEIISAVSGINSYMNDMKIPPHVTLAAFKTDKIAPVENAIRELIKSGKWRSGNIVWASLGAFVPAVLFASPVFSDYLNTLNTEINALIEEIPDCEKDPYYAPNNWVPHTALALKMTASELTKAFEIAAGMFSPLGGTAEKLFLAECNPFREIGVFDL